jgi:hypothetical protein
MALAATPARALAQARQERMPATVLELDLDTCTNTYGVAPCVAGRKDSGTAQAGGASTITLRAAASAGDDSYKGMTVRLTGGTGALQERKILSYVGATKIATLTTAWGTPPDATSTYDVIDRANGCYNVFAGQSPCQSQANYAKGVKTVKFCSRGMPLPAGEQIRPYIATATFTPTEIDTTKGLAARSQTTVSLADEPCRDDLDLYAADRATPAAGTYWTRLIARNPNAIGRFARMRKGYVVSPWDWGTFQTELYIVEGIAGPDDNGRVDVALSDAVKLLDRVKIPAATDGKLTADVPATFNTGIVASATSTSVVLATSASAVDSAYNGQEILITGGLGLNQRRVISAYVGLSRTATVAAWTTVPDATSLYEVAPLSLNVGAGKGAQYNDPAVTLRNEYVRVGDEVIRYGAKAGDVLSWPDGSYRAQFSTTRADHKANDGAQQCLARIAATASSWVRDMLNVSLADGYLDLVQLAQEEADWFGTKALITACIGESETGSALLTDLLKDLNMMVWWHPVEQKVKFKVNMPAIGDAAGSLTDDNFIFGQVAAEKLDMERLTRSEIDFDLVSATIDRKKRTNYRTVQIFIDTAAESPNGYGDVRADTRQSRWLTAPNAVFAAGVVERRLLAVRDAPWKLTASLDPRDEVALGSLRDVTTRKIVDAAGNPLTLRHRVMKVTDQGAQIDIEMRSTTFGKRYAFICPNGYPDYPSASFNQRQRAFIAGDTDVMSDGSSAYLII